MNYSWLLLFLSCVGGRETTAYLRGSSAMEEEELHWKSFLTFQEKFHKNYGSAEEWNSRYSIFRDNLIDIWKHNALPNQNFTLGINAFTDLTNEEFKRFYASGLTTSSSLSSSVGSFGCKPFVPSSSSSSIDWRSNGIVNPVRDQGQCGSCWAFSTTSNAESVWAISSGKLYDLSEEWLVDCATGVGYFNMGCNGGNIDSALKYMINEGQCLETAYPYQAGTSQTAGKCHDCVNPPPNVHFSACYDVKSGDQVALKSAVSLNPVVVAIDASSKYFQSYSSGTLDSKELCGSELNHAVEIVGFTADSWIVRNSWGSDWGDAGYVQIHKSGSTADTGVCGIASQPSFLAV